MTISSQKKLAWFLFAASLGSLLLFAFVVVFIFMNTSLPGGFTFGGWFRRIYWWPLGSLVVWIWVTIRLVQFYRREPWQHPGKLHLSLGDFYVATFFAALCMGIWQDRSPDNFLYWGAGLSVVAGVWLLLALLAAIARGYTRAVHKLPLAIGLALKSYGYLALGMFGVFCLLTLVLDGPRVLGQLFNWLWRGVPSGMNNPFLEPIFASLPALPTGWLICKLVYRHARK